MDFTEIMAAMADLEARHADLPGVMAVFMARRGRCGVTLIWGTDIHQEVEAHGYTAEGAFAEISRKMRERAKNALAVA
jgi:hypothetical protein